MLHRSAESLRDKRADSATPLTTRLAGAARLELRRFPPVRANRRVARARVRRGRREPADAQPATNPKGSQLREVRRSWDPKRSLAIRAGCESAGHGFALHVQEIAQSFRGLGRRSFRLSAANERRSGFCFRVIVRARATRGTHPVFEVCDLRHDKRQWSDATPGGLASSLFRVTAHFQDVR